ncbi:MAG: DUF4340 domain-containing protein [Candidatus Riflebacteria bacterium]|nr:DUF4340 domain-containing protein [Candidatus Riflebacteria bacterium]
MITKILPTLIAVALLAIGIVYVYKYESDEMPDRDKAESVIVQDKDSLTKITLKGAKGLVVFERQTQGDKKEWKITSPLKVEPDSIKMDDLVGKLAKLESKRLVTEKIDKPLADYGLDKPTTTVEYESSKGNGSILIGRQSDVETSWYVKRGDTDRLFLCESWGIEVFQSEFNQFRDKKIMKVDPDKATIVKIVGEKGARTFKREDKEKWTVEVSGQRPMRGNTQAIRNILYAMNNLAVEEFVNDSPKPEDLAKYGFAKSDHTVTITFEKDEGTRTLLVGKKKEGDLSRTYVKRDTADNVFAVSNTSLIDLTKPIEEFKDQKLFEFSSTKLKKLTVALGSRVATAERDAKGNWAFAKPIVRKEAHTATSVLANALEALKAKSYATDDKSRAAEFRLDPPEMTITFEGEGVPASMLVLGQPVADKGRYMRIGTDPFLAIPEDDPYAKAKAIVDAYLAVLDLPADTVTGMKVACGKESCELAKDEKSGWQLKEPKSVVLNDPPGKAAAVIDALGAATAEEFIPSGPGPIGEFGLGSPEYKVVLTFKSGAPLTVDVGPAQGPRRGVLTSAHDKIARLAGGDLVAKLADLTAPIRKPASPVKTSPSSVAAGPAPAHVESPVPAPSPTPRTVPAGASPPSPVAPASARAPGLPPAGLPPIELVPPPRPSPSPGSR